MSPTQLSPTPPLRTVGVPPKKEELSKKVSEKFAPGPKANQHLKAAKQKKNIQTNAALKIQAAFRGYRIQKQGKAAFKIQAAFRGYRLKKSYVDIEAAMEKRESRGIVKISSDFILQKELDELRGLVFRVQEFLISLEDNKKREAVDFSVETYSGAYEFLKKYRLGLAKLKNFSVLQKARKVASDEAHETATEQLIEAHSAAIDAAETDAKIEAQRAKLLTLTRTYFPKNKGLNSPKKDKLGAPFHNAHYTELFKQATKVKKLQAAIDAAAAQELEDIKAVGTAEQAAASDAELSPAPTAEEVVAEPEAEPEPAAEVEMVRAEAAGTAEQAAEILIPVEQGNSLQIGAQELAEEARNVRVFLLGTEYKEKSSGVYRNGRLVKPGATTLPSCSQQRPRATTPPSCSQQRPVDKPRATTPPRHPQQRLGTPPADESSVSDAESYDADISESDSESDAPIEGNSPDLEPESAPELATELKPLDMTSDPVLECAVKKYSDPEKLIKDLEEFVSNNSLGSSDLKMQLQDFLHVVRMEISKSSILDLYFASLRDYEIDLAHLVIGTEKSLSDYMDNSGLSLLQEFSSSPQLVRFLKMRLHFTPILKSSDTASDDVDFNNLCLVCRLYQDLKEEFKPALLKLVKSIIGVETSDQESEYKACLDHYYDELVKTLVPRLAQKEAFVFDAELLDQLATLMLPIYYRGIASQDLISHFKKLKIFQGITKQDSDKLFEALKYKVAIEQKTLDFYQGSSINSLKEFVELCERYQQELSYIKGVMGNPMISKKTNDRNEAFYHFCYDPVVEEVVKIASGLTEPIDCEMVFESKIDILDDLFQSIDSAFEIAMDKGVIKKIKPDYYYQVFLKLNQLPIFKNFYAYVYEIKDQSNYLEATGSVVSDMTCQGGASSSLVFEKPYGNNAVIYTPLKVSDCSQPVHIPDTSVLKRVKRLENELDMVGQQGLVPPLKPNEVCYVPGTPMPGSVDYLEATGRVVSDVTCQGGASRPYNGVTDTSLKVPDCLDPVKCLDLEDELKNGVDPQLPVPNSDGRWYISGTIE